MNDKSSIKCVNEDFHDIAHGGGRLLAIFGKDCIYLHCGNNKCKRWTKVTISFPGINLDFSKAAIIRELMPEGYHFDVSDISSVVGK